MLDMHVHLIGHLDREATEENIRPFLAQATQKKIRQIGFADHDMYWDQLDFDLIRRLAIEEKELQVRTGLEVDYRPELESDIQQKISSYPFDYVIGSVHQLGNWFFDFPEEEATHARYHPDEIYQQYFQSVEKAATSGMFQIIGHFDLIKLFNLRPLTDVRKIAARALEAIKDLGLVVEVNTNGRYKPVREFYPENKLIERMLEMEIPLTLSSDAHEAKVVGRDLDQAKEMLYQLGCRELIGFEQRQRQRYPLDLG